MIKKLIISAMVILAIAYACKEKFSPDIDYPNTGYLVVEGFINSGSGATTIRLSRTAKLTDTARRYELGATVTVEGDNNSRYVLAAQGSGLYVNNQLALDRTKKFRLHIRTTTGKEYFSDYASPITTPPIDSVFFTREDVGLAMHVATHDPQNKARYYTWNYEETWEINSTYTPNLKYVRAANNKVIGVANINPNGAPDTTKYRCWQFQNSTDVLIGSSIKLVEDRINLPLYSIPYGSIKTTVLYSVKMYQHALSERGYDFLQRMKKNTQQVGSIFDSQPSELNTNIHNVSDPTEVIIGFIDVTDAQEQRIYIDPRKESLRPFVLDCFTYVVTMDSLDYYSYLDPIEYQIAPSGAPGVFSVSPQCDDCTLRGTNKRPTYWPR